MAVHKVKSSHIHYNSNIAYREFKVEYITVKKAKPYTNQASKFKTIIVKKLCIGSHSSRTYRAFLNSTTYVQKY